jgi:hypothetical protein
VPKILIVDRPDSDVLGWALDGTGAVERIAGGDSDVARAVNIVRESAQLTSLGVAEPATKAGADIVNAHVGIPVGEEKTVFVITGTDAGDKVITLHKDGHITIEHTPGYMVDAGAVTKIVRAAARLTTPGLAEKTTKAVASYLVDEVAARYADASLVVVG